MMSETTQIAVIGAGFSGVVTAVHLLRAGRSVTLINRSGRMARGVAYGTNAAAHVLNVPAGRMSAFPDDEESFLRFARDRDATVDGGSFVSRSTYGEYLDHTLAEAERAAPGGARLERIVGHVADIGPRAGESRAFVTLARSEEHTSELQSQSNLVCRLLLEKKNKCKTRERFRSSRSQRRRTSSAFNRLSVRRSAQTRSISR